MIATIIFTVFILLAVWSTIIRRVPKKQTRQKNRRTSIHRSTTPFMGRLNDLAWRKSDAKM